MKVKLRVMPAMALCILVLLNGLARAQSDVPRFEVGAQYSLLDFDTSAAFSKAHRWESGVGGRFTFNFNKHVAAEAQIDFFPAHDIERIGPYEVLLWGSKTLTVAGVKAGTRGKRFGIFGKARPGFIHFSEVPGFGCLAIIVPCLQPAKTNFAFDVGGVFEYYPSRRIVARFDAGDTIIQHKTHFGTNHQFQSSVGVGLRF
jgi:hypothetical protein